MIFAKTHLFIGKYPKGLLVLKRKGCFVTAVALLLSLVTVFSVVCAAAAGDYDASLPSSSHNAAVNSAELLESALGAPLTEGEREYLANHGELTLRYNTAIPTRVITTEYISDTLTVSVLSYTYEAKDGSSVTWYPTKATLLGEEKALVLDGESYRCDFVGVERRDGLSVSVSFKASFIIKEEDLNAVINKAYTDARGYAEELDRKNREYLSLKAEYDGKLASYEQYLLAMSEYELKYAAYTEYLSKKIIYEDALKEYNRYLDELSAYEQALIEYTTYDERLQKYNEDYALYRAYLTELQNYETKKAEYNAYLDKKRVADSQMEVIKLFKVSNGKIGSYSAIMGPTVTKVLDNKKVLIDNSVGASPETIDRAYEATNALRVLLPEYFALESDLDRYAYYCVHHEEFRDNVIKLLVSLDELYSNKRVRAMIIAEEKNDKFISLIAFLSVIARGLKDGEVLNHSGTAYSSSYKVDGKTVSSILGSKVKFTDTENAEPLAEGYPAAVAKPKVPKEVKEPIKPQPVSEPTAPEAVEHPGKAPTEVKEPTAPEAVEHPGKEPVPYIPQAEIARLVEEYNEGKLSEREELTEDYTYIADTSIKKTVFGGSVVTVLFLNEEDEELYRTETEKGGLADYVGELPRKSEDSSATYEFSGWTEQKGSEILFDLKSVSADGTVRLYPAYKKNIKKYKITFSVEGVLTEKYVPYGQLPVFEGVPEKPYVTDSDYVFSGWSSPICAVTGDKTYTATFERRYLLPLEDGGARITVEEGYISADEISVSQDKLDISRLLARASLLKKGIKIDTVKGKVTLSYSSVLELIKGGCNYLDIKTVQVGTAGYRYRVEAFDASLTALSISARLDGEFPSLIGDGTHTKLYKLDEKGERVYVRCALSEEKSSFVLDTGVDYYLVTEYSISIIPSDIVTTIVDKTLVPFGGYVTVNCEAPEGYRITRIYLVNLDGTETELAEQGFNMPAHDVSLGAEYEPITYKITFMNGDKVIATATYYYGDTVIPPADPTKMSSGNIGYTFKEWYPAIATVTSDATYHAEFKAHLLPPAAPPGPGITPDVLGLLVGAAVGTGIFLFGFAPSLLVFFIRRRRLNKRIFGKKNKKK